MEHPFVKIENLATKRVGAFDWLPGKHRLGAIAVAWLFIIALGLAILFISAPTFGRLHPDPIESAPLPVLFEVPPFTLTNQTGKVTSLADLRGQVWVADTIFTRCDGPCPRMTQRLGEIQASLPLPSPVKLVSLTTDPEYDTPSVLQAYGEHYGASTNRWWFLTGDKASLAHLAIDGLKFAVVEKETGERGKPDDLFIHSTFFLLIDQQCRARGIYHYGDREMKTRLLRDIQRLLAER